MVDRSPFCLSFDPLRKIDAIIIHSSQEIGTHLPIKLRLNRKRSLSSSTLHTRVPTVMMDTQSSLMPFLSVFWKKYNSSDSMLPLLIPMIIWVSTYSYCRVQKQEFHRWYSLHNFHNFGAMGLGLVSLYFDNDAVFNERIPTLFSIGYFIVDVVDTG
jgi:hypothetical protein